MMVNFEDTVYHQKLRKRLVKELAGKGISDPRILKAIELIPRHWFLSQEQEKEAYLDKALPIDQGQTISQPYTVAYQTQLLDINQSDSILEIGTGSGYQAVVLALLAKKVFTIERQKKLFDNNDAFEYLHQFQNIRFFYGDGHEGLPEYAPFDKILITAASSFIPSPLINQLKPEGLLVLPLGSAALQQMVRITKKENGELIKEYFHHFSFVPLLEGKAD